MKHRVSKRRDRKIFAKTAGRINKMNLPGRSQRGGTRF